MAELLISKGADVNAKIKRYDRVRMTPLNYAVRSGHADVAALLLAHGAKADVNDFCGHPPIYSAAIRARRDLVELLLDHGADVNSRAGSIRQTPLQWAADTDKVEVANFSSPGVQM